MLVEFRFDIDHVKIHASYLSTSILPYYECEGT